MKYGLLHIVMMKMIKGCSDAWILSEMNGKRVGGNIISFSYDRKWPARIPVSTNVPIIFV
jgi:hypothetical protein